MNAPEDMEQLWKRYSVLSALAEQPQSSRQLEEKLDVSRATVHRATKMLANLELIEDHGNRFKLSPLGTIGLTSATQSLTALTVGQNLEPVLRNVEAELLIENIHRFEGADVLVRDNKHPLTIENRIIQTIDQSDSMKRVSYWRVWTKEVVNTIIRNVEAGMPYELMLPPSEWEQLAADFEDDIERLSSLETLSVFVHDNIPFSFYIVDELVQIPAFDDSGNITALAESNNQDAAEWMEFLFSSLKADSRKVV